MTVSTVQTNNKLVQYVKEINREYVRENLFSPYMGEASNSIIRIRNETKKGGEQINIPLLARLAGAGLSTGTLVGAEEELNDYGYRVWVDFARNAVRTNKYQAQIDSADVFGEAKPHLSDWGKELQKLEIIQALGALPTESAPAGLAGSAGQRVNGILLQSATAGQMNTFTTDNSDRILFGATTTNAVSGVFATALALVDATNDKLSGAAVSLMKFLAKHANPRIRPYQTENGREYFVLFCGGLPFRDLKIDLKTSNTDGRERNVETNPIFQDGDLIWDGVIIREIPEIDDLVRSGGIWNTAMANGGVLAHPVWLCGQSAVAMPWGQMAKPTFLKEDDYQFNVGAGIEMCYGVGKVFKKHPKASTPLKQWGVVSGFFAASAT